MKSFNMLFKISDKKSPLPFPPPLSLSFFPDDTLNTRLEEPCSWPFNSQDLMANSPLALLHISF